jgi:hypothetical protein
MVPIKFGLSGGPAFPPLASTSPWQVSSFYFSQQFVQRTFPSAAARGQPCCFSISYWLCSCGLFDLEFDLTTASRAPVSLYIQPS